jgi:hypothetical protein
MSRDVYQSGQWNWGLCQSTSSHTLQLSLKLAEWRENQIPIPVDKPEHWTIYFDGSLKLDGGGAGVLFISSKGEQLKYVLQILWEVSNNEDEYEALL